MVVSVNHNAHKAEFDALLNSTLLELNAQAKKSSTTLISLTGNKLEPYIKDLMTSLAVKTPFENSIELISGQKFPDIVAKKYYGVEVKTTTQNHWRTTGNSILESTRVEGVERIFMLFGKLVKPIEFRYRPYEDCLSEVVVTHSPRYLIDMNLGKGATIFDKMGISYDELRKKENPIKSIKDYYRDISDEGDDVWWIDNDNKTTSFIVKSWSNLEEIEKSAYVARAMVYFPEVFGGNQQKFNRVAIWLSTSENIVHPNVRDSFTAGGTENIKIGSKLYQKVPRIFITLREHLPAIINILKKSSVTTLSEFWGHKVAEKNKFPIWLDQVVNYSEDFRNANHLDIRKFISDSSKKL